MRYSLQLAKEKFKNKKVTVAEVGVMCGNYSKELYKNLTIKQLYLIDSWDLKYNKNAFDNLKTTCQVMDLKNVYILKMESQLATQILNLKFDYVYLDNIHSAGYLYKEMGWWWPLINKGGILAGHDYTSKKPTRVKAGVELFCKKRNLVYEFSELNKNEKVGDWAIRKPIDTS